MSDEKDDDKPGPAPFDDDALRKLVKRAMSEGSEPSASTTTADAALDEPPPSVEDVPLPEGAVEDVAIQNLLRKAVEREPAVVPDLVSGVQRKLRKRSRGKFYRDRFSTTQSRLSYALVAVAMLVVVALAYLVLGPTGVSGH